MIDNRKVNRIEVPKKIQQLKKINMLLCLIFFVTLGAIGYIYISEESSHKKFVKQNFNEMVIALSGLIGILMIVNFYKIYLQQKTKNLVENDHKIAKKMTEFTTLLGSKVTTILKNHLCK